MTATFDMSGLAARSAALRAALPASLATHVPEAGLDAVFNSGYAAGSDAEQATIDPASLLTELETDGTVATVGIIQLYDWVIEPGAQHCFSPDGLDCPTFAANGPYTAEQMTARPGDGTTPCKDRCHCTWEPRPPLFETDITDALAAAGAAVRGDLAAAWGA